MPHQLRPIDDGPTAVLTELPGFSELTLPELGALVDTLRKAADDIPAADSSSLQRMWYEIASLRMEVRNAFIIKFTEGR